MAPRDLSLDQITKMGTSLKQFSGQTWTITTHWDSKEPIGSREQDSQRWISAQWRYDNQGSKSMLLGGIEGVQIAVHPQASPNAKAAADALSAALNSEGISTVIKPQNDPGHPTDKLWLTVGSKP